LQDIEVGKQKHLHVYQADQLNFRQGVCVWNLHPFGGLHIGGIHFENKMAAIALKFVVQIYVF
jgi:hypothetical protein